MHFLLDTYQIAVTSFLNGKTDYEVTVWQKSWSLYRRNNLGHFFYVLTQKLKTQKQDRNENIRFTHKINGL